MRLKILITVVFFGSIHFIMDYNDIKYYQIAQVRPLAQKILDQLFYESLHIRNQSESNSSNHTTVDTKKCQPYLPDVQQFSVLLDNQTYPKQAPLYRNKTINFECLNIDTSKKIILFWNPFFGDKYYTWKNGLAHGKCPVTNCELTDNKTKLNDADLVITHMRDSLHEIDLKATRPKNQRWVFLLYESPIHTPDYTKYNNFYNLTSTYKIDSDFAHFYEDANGMVWKRNPEFNVDFDFHAEKTGFATAVISNCGQTANRLKYIQAISNWISMDVFGKCGKPVPSNKAMLAKMYKFYFAFENSLCDDYITEKFFNILPFNTIPVVRGGGNYANYIPRSGFIDARDYKTPQKLADYLHYLDKNKTAYNAYFKWKKNVVFENSFIVNFAPICDMCIKLNLEKFSGVKKSIINDLKDYWGVAKNCKRVNNLNDIN